MRPIGKRQQRANWYVRLHRGTMKPPYPILIFCPNCGHGLIQVNAETIEISNGYGLPSTEIEARDVWQRIIHSCKAAIVLYWT